MCRFCSFYVFSHLSLHGIVRDTEKMRFKCAEFYMHFLVFHVFHVSIPVVSFSTFSNETKTRTWFIFSSFVRKFYSFTAIWDFFPSLRLGIIVTSKLCIKIPTFLIYSAFRTAIFLKLCIFLVYHGFEHLFNVFSPKLRFNMRTPYLLFCSVQCFTYGGNHLMASLIQSKTGALFSF